MKIKAHIHAVFDEHYDPNSKKYVKGWRYEAWPCESKAWGVCVGEVDVEVPAVDEAELAKGQVSLMREQQQKIRAEAEVRFQQIEESIQKMLCLEYKAEEQQ